MGVLYRTTLLSYLKSLTDAKFTDSLFKDLKGVSSLQKPDKIFLENTNLMYLYQGENVDAGNVRETFLVNQLSYNQTVELSEVSDFFVNGKYTKYFYAPNAFMNSSVLLQYLIPQFSKFHSAIY